MFQRMTRLWRQGEWLVFEREQEAAQPARPREDLQVVPVRSVAQLKRYWTDWPRCMLGPSNRLMWQGSLLLGRQMLFLGLKDGRCVHFSWCCPLSRTVLRRYMPADIYHIGPSATQANYRGQQIYPYVLGWITNYLIREQGVRRFVMLTEPANRSSIRGILKAGFRLSKVLRYRAFLRAAVLYPFCVLLRGQVHPFDEAAYPDLAPITRGTDGDSRS